MQAKKILEKLHETLNHPGIQTSYETLRKYWIIPKLKEKLKEQREKCQTCQKYLKTTHKYGKIKGSIHTESPFKDICSDIYGPINTSFFEEGNENNKIYLLSITDRCTRWSEIYMLKDLYTSSIINGFKSWINNNPHPETILTDQGRPYISQEFSEFCESNNIKHRMTTTYNPTGNSISERLNQTITRVLQVNQKQPLKRIIKKINWTLQNQYHRSLNCSPHELKYKYSMYDPYKRQLNNLIPKALITMNKHAIYNNKRINKNRKNYVFNQGDVVYKSNPKTNKLEASWKGPYVIKNIDEDKYVVTLESSDHTLKTNIKYIRPIRREVDVRDY